MFFGFKIIIINSYIFLIVTIALLTGTPTFRNNRNAGFEVFPCQPARVYISITMLYLSCPTRITLR